MLSQPLSLAGLIETMPIPTSADAHDRSQLLSLAGLIDRLTTVPHGFGCQVFLLGRPREHRLGFATRTGGKIASGTGFFSLESTR